VAVDYFTNYPEIELLKNTTSSTVIGKLKSIFSRHGIPQVLISDNGPQFTSQDFKDFSTKWRFEHDKSSPYFP